MIRAIKLMISEANMYHKNFMDLLREYSNLNKFKWAIDYLCALISKCNKEVEIYLLKKPRKSPRVHFKNISTKKSPKRSWKPLFSMSEDMIPAKSGKKVDIRIIYHQRRRRRSTDNSNSSDSNNDDSSPSRHRKDR